jgi:putative membrane protein
MADILPANIALEKKLNRVSWFVSIVVFLVVVLMRRVKIDTAIDFSFLPPLYSSLNAITAILLIVALFLIKRGMANGHRKVMTMALATSVLFLLCYVLYHITTPDTKYCGVGLIRYFYFFLLISHIVLAAVILPFILFTYIRAYTNQFSRHKSMARWVFPLWLYVAITGPVIYLMLEPCY